MSTWEMVDLNLEGAVQQLRLDAWWVRISPKSFGGAFELVVQNIDEFPWEELDKLPKLRQIYYYGSDPELISYISRRPGITELHWHDHSCETMDLSRSSLRVIYTGYGAGDLEIKLPDTAHDFHIHNPDDFEGLTVSAKDQGRGVYLNCWLNKSTARPRSISGLSGIKALSIWYMRQLDVADLLSYSHLERLDIRGPCFD